MTPRLPYILLFGSAALPLVLALISQYGFGMAPCVLCVYQRIPLIVILAVVALGLLLQKKIPFLVILVVCILLFLTNSGIAFFHVGVEYGWWEGTSSCGGSVKATSLEALRESILRGPVANCSAPAFVFLGLSMAGWNIVYSLAAALYFSSMFVMKGK